FDLERLTCDLLNAGEAGRGLWVGREGEMEEVVRIDAGRFAEWDMERPVGGRRLDIVNERAEGAQAFRKRDGNVIRDVEWKILADGQPELERAGFRRAVGG